MIAKNICCVMYVYVYVYVERKGAIQFLINNTYRHNVYHTERGIEVSEVTENDARDTEMVR